MPNFVTKPTKVVAYQFDGTYESMVQIRTLFPNLNTLSAEYHSELNTVNHWKIKAVATSQYVGKTDWIILGSNGQFHTCSQDLFVSRFDLVD